jgi:hypothetical protein
LGGSEQTNAGDVGNAAEPMAEARDISGARGVVLIHRTSVSAPGWYYSCTGSMLNGNVILSAGHCVSEDPEARYTIYYFDPRTGKRRVTGERERLGVARHERYRERDGVADVAYDLGILVRRSPWAYTSERDYLYVQQGNIISYYPTHNSVRAYGAGVDAEDGSGRDELETYGHVLRYVDPYWVSLREDYGTGGRLCKGDSGGPLTFVWHEELPSIVAVNSAINVEDSADLCRSVSGYSYHTRVYPHLDWLQRAAERLLGRAMPCVPYEFDTEPVRVKAQKCF